MGFIKKDEKIVYQLIGGNKFYVFKVEKPELTSDMFAFTVDTTLGDGDPSMKLPLRDGYDYDFVVDWGDGTQDTITSYDQAETDHTYTLSREYQISIKGTCKAWHFNNDGDKDKLISIDQWGDTGFRKMSSAFRGCSNLTSVNDTGDGSWSSDVTDVNSMFEDCTSLTGITGLENWDVSSVNRISSMFDNCTSINNIDLSNWDISNVDNMSRMFSHCTSLTNIDVTDLVKSNINDLSDVFYNCSSLTDIIGLDTWNISNVTNMRSTFAGLVSFDNFDKLSNWDTSSVTTMRNTFNNSSIEILTPLSDWVTSGVTNMGGMFKNCSSLEDISDSTNWDVSNVTNMYDMFLNCDSGSFTDMSPVSSWNIESIEPHSSTNTSMHNMFAGAVNLTQLSFDDVLQAWSTLPSIPTDVRIDVATSHTSGAQSAYDSLVDDYNWEINENVT